MRTRRLFFISVCLLVLLAVLRSVILETQQWNAIWLVLVATVGPWIVWDTSKALYTAAMEGFFVTELYGKVNRETESRLFRNNLIAHIVLLPIIAGGAVIMLLDALEAMHIIR